MMPRAVHDDAITRVSRPVGVQDVQVPDLVQVQVSCSDLSLYKTFNDVYRQSFAKTFPTRAFLGAPTLLKGCRYEIIGIAVRR